MTDVGVFHLRALRLDIRIPGRLVDVSQLRLNYPLDCLSVCGLLRYKILTKLVRTMKTMYVHETPSPQNGNEGRIKLALVPNSP